MPNDYSRTTEVIVKALLIMYGQPGSEKVPGDGGGGEGKKKPSFSYFE